MKQLTVASDFYTAGFDFRVPQVPGAPEGTAGVFVFALGTPYEVTDDTAKAVETAYLGFPERVRRRLRLSIAPSVASIAAAAAIAAPAAPPASSAEVVNAVEEVLPEVFEPTIEDGELISAELDKLQGLTIAKATPIVEKTALDDGLPIELRRAYLEGIQGGAFQAGLQAKAKELLEAIA